jgi:hypothetical protein
MGKGQESWSKGTNGNEEIEQADTRKEDKIVGKNFRGCQ